MINSLHINALCLFSLIHSVCEVINDYFSLFHSNKNSTQKNTIPLKNTELKNWKTKTEKQEKKAAFVKKKNETNENK